MHGRMSQCQNTFGHLVNLQQQIVIQFFKFQMEFKKFITLDIPMIPPCILIKDGIVGQQFIKFFG